MNTYRIDSGEYLFYIIKHNELKGNGYVEWQC